MKANSEARHINPEAAWKMVEEGRDPVFLDTRNAKHWAESDVQIRGTLRLWREELADRIKEVPRGRPVITYCA